ncbi:MAG TPA: tetraacyldisaccharide 4'-kinase [Planctomycetes bacterium]|nr:tetraacyldisaccharide 4'-kinase [Planctomycetota bacterium]HIL52911.1 tetraacyldisaccharide 4'-kinase [Planctomycetota bacterium]
MAPREQNKVPRELMKTQRERPDVWLARRGGLVELLRLPALGMRAVTGTRNWMYDHRLLPSVTLDAPVVSVGNLTVGGTGKTPMVVWLAQEFARRGRRVGLLSRGYGAWETGAGLNDEGRLLAELLPGVPHIQRPDRVAGGRELLLLGVDLILLDDGFQHRRLKRDLDLVLIDAMRPFGLPDPDDQGRPVCDVLPRGLLREDTGSLKRAQAVILTRSDGVSAERLSELEEQLEREAPGLPRSLARHRASGLRRGSERLELAQLRGKAVVLVSGLGNPAAFEKSARDLGAEVRGVHTFADHHEYTESDVQPLLAEDSELLVTAKDAVKLETLGLPHLVLEVEFEITRGERVLAALLDALPESSQEQRLAAQHAGLHG